VNDFEDRGFTEILTGIDAQMPLPSAEFSERLWGELRDEIEGSADGLKISDGRDEDQDPTPLLGTIHNPPEPEQGGPGWLFAAAMVLLALIGGGVYAIGRTGTPEIVVADVPTTAATADEPIVTVPTTTIPDDAMPDVDLDFAVPLGLVEANQDSIRLTFTTTKILFDSLDSSSVYFVEVTLIGDGSSVRSERLEVRTAGDLTPVTIGGLELVQTTSSSAELRFTTNLCARSSYVVLDAVDQSQVQRTVADLDAPCASDHELTVGDAEALESNTRYIVVVEAVAVDNPTNLTSETIFIETALAEGN